MEHTNGEALKKLIAWRFDQRLQAGREQVEKHKLSIKKLIEDDEIELLEAVRFPKTSAIASELFYFIETRYESAMTYLPGMQPTPKGVDILQLEALANKFLITSPLEGTILQYEPFINLYQEEYFKKISRDKN